MRVVVQIPSKVSFEEGATLFTGVATIANSLYSHKPGTESLRLSPPWEDGRSKYSGKSILVLGGATQLGQYGALIVAVIRSVRQLIRVVSSYAIRQALGI